MKTTILFACLLFHCGTHAQTESFLPRRHTLKLAPFRLIHISEPAIELSYEYRFNHQWAAQVRTGYIVRLFDDPIVKRQSGYIAGIEGRHYFSRRNDFFIGSEVAYTDYTADCTAEFTETGSILNPATYSDDFQLSKSVFAATLRIGKTFQFNHVGMEVSVGYSTVTRTVEHSGRLHPEDNFTYQGFKTALRGMDEGSYWFFRVPGQFRVSYSF
jgi:hypothetical protein